MANLAPRRPATYCPSRREEQFRHVSSNSATFRVTNLGPRAILLIDLVVETNSPKGWQSVSHTVPTHPQRLAPEESKDLVAATPAGASWRLRVAFGTDVKGPMLEMEKAAYAIAHFRLTGPGFGVMAGSNSCVSMLITN